MTQAKLHRQRNDGLRKRCACRRRAWATCAHPWFFNFKVRGGLHYRFRLDTYAEQPIRTREEAYSERDRLRRLIRSGQFPPMVATPAPPTQAPEITFTAFAELWRTRARGDQTPRQQADDASRCRVLASVVLEGSTFGAQAIGLITEDTIEAAFATLRGRAANTQNKYRGLVLQLQRWGVKKGYLARPWLSADAVARDGPLPHQRPTRRHRRLTPDALDANGQLVTPGEERRLLAQASPWLYRLVVAAIETCCRQGELLTLTWGDVSLTRGEIRIRDEHSKTGIGRTIPISPRLRAVLTLIASDPDGEPWASTAHVFGNGIGEAVGSPKKAWETLVLRAHGHTPVWVRPSGKLSAESRAALRAADLHFHDLRHEGASRLLEQGWPLHHVQIMCGHADAKTTSIYTNADIRQLHDSMRRFSGQPLHAVAPEVPATFGVVGNASQAVPVSVRVN